VVVMMSPGAPLSDLVLELLCVLRKETRCENLNTSY
jgi:hypothetical protein